MSNDLLQETTTDSTLLEATDAAYNMVFKSIVDFSCIKAAFELKVFDILADGPRNLSDLAQLTEGVPARLERFLVALQHLNLVSKSGENWKLTPLAAQFFVSSPANRNLNMVPFVEYSNMMMEHYYLHLSEVVRGRSNFTSFVPHPPRTREDSLFYETLHRSNLVFPIKLLTESAHLAGVRQLLDVGGGIGDIAAALCKKYPELNVTLINLPSALDLVRENVATHGLTGRIEPVAIDLYREPYPTSDAVLFCRMLYPLNEKLCAMLCQKAYAALKPGGRIFILDMIIHDLEHPNYDYLTHYLGGVGMDFSPLEFKSHEVYPSVLQSVGFSEVECILKYEHVLYQAVKPAALN